MQCHSGFSRLVTRACLPAPKRSWFDRALTIGPFTLARKDLSPGAEDVIRCPTGLLMQAFEMLPSRHAVSPIV